MKIREKKDGIAHEGNYRQIVARMASYDHEAEGGVKEYMHLVKDRLRESCCQDINFINEAGFLYELKRVGYIDFE